MDKNKRTVLIVAIGAASCLVVLGLVYRYVGRINQIPCSDGSKRVRLDTQAFETQYSVNTLRLELGLKNKPALTAELGAKQLQQMTEAVQLARLHLQALADGYDACVVSPSEFNESRNRFQRMEAIAGEINQITSRQSLSVDDHKQVSKLIDDFIALSH